MGPGNAPKRAPLLKLRILGFFPLLAAAAVAADGVLDSRSPVSVFTAREMAGKGIESLDDILEKLPANTRAVGDVLSLSPTVVGRIDIRGVNVPAAGAMGPGQDRPQVLIDGRSASGTNTFGPYGIPVHINYDDIPIAAFGRVEVLRESAGAMYGSDAIAGVINFVTRNDVDSVVYGESPTFKGVYGDLNRYFWYSAESPEDCDSVNGELQPFWSLFPKHDWGGPVITDGGNTWQYGSKADGFEPGSIPFSEFFSYEAQSEWFPLEREDLSSPEAMRANGYNALADLVERVTNDPDLSTTVKASFGLMLGMGWRFTGLEQFSDFAILMGDFDPEKFFNNMKAVDAEFGLPHSPASPSVDWESAAQPAAAPLAGDLPEPFTGFAYPPEYLLDDPNDCPEEVKSKVRKLMRQRDQARADRSYYTDLAGDRYSSPEDRAENVAKATEARRVRDATNDEIKILLSGCGKSAQSAGDVQPTGDAKAAVTDPVTNADDAQSADVEDGVDYKFDSGKGWKIEFNYSRSASDDEGNIFSEPVPNLRLGMSRYNFDMEFRLPNAFGALRDTETGVEGDDKQAFTGADGKAEFEWDDLAPSIGMQYILTDKLILRSGYGNSPGTGQSVNSGWKIGLDFNLGKVKVNTRLEKVDSVNQVFPGMGDNSRSSLQHVPTDLFVDIPVVFQNYVNDAYSIGKDFYLSFTFPEYRNLDLTLLYGIGGQSGFENNFCGDTALPPDDARSSQSNIDSVDDQWALGQVGVGKDAAIAGEGAQPVIVGIIDTGLDWNHLDLSWDNIWQNEDEIADNGIDDDGNGYVDDIIGWDFVNKDNKPWDNDGHGTFVAGIITAVRDNGIGIDGINPNARLMVLKALNNFGRTRASYVAQAIVYGADNGARILNLSVSGTGMPRVVQKAIDYAEGKGVLVIVAAGNRAEDIASFSPAGLQRVMTVAATNSADKRAKFSNTGRDVAIAAPGVDVVSLRARRTDFMRTSDRSPYEPGASYIGSDQRYYVSSGTSFAAPIVSGIASLLWSQSPELSHVQVRRILEQSARDIESPGKDYLTGYGIVDAQAALAADPEFYIHADIERLGRVEIASQEFVEVVGSATANQFGRGWLELGAGEEPTTWRRVGTLLVNPIDSGVLSEFRLDELETGTVWVLRVTVEHVNGKTREVRYRFETGQE